MNAVTRAAARDELQRLHDRAEALADTLDPSRTFTGKDELTREIVKAADQITRAATRALSMLRVTEERG